MKKNLLRLFSLALVTLGMASCSDNDYFSLEDYQKLIKKSFPVENVDPNHTWATMGSALATITVNGDYAETYTVGIFLENPRTGENLTQLFKGTVESGNTISVNVSYPLTAEQVYVGIYDKAGRRIIMTAPIENNRINVTYDNGAGRGSKAITRATETEEAQYAKSVADFLNPTSFYQKVNDWDWVPEIKTITEADMATYPVLSDNDLPATLSDGWWTWSAEKGSYQEFIGGGDGKHFRIPAETVVTKVFHMNAASCVNDGVIYVQGTLHLCGNTLNGPTLVVANGGEIVLDTDNKFTGYARFVVLEGGTISGANGTTLEVTNGAPCYNAGEIDFEGMVNLNGSNFYNCGTVNVSYLTGTSGGTHFVNFGRITAVGNNNAASTYNQSWVNGCYIHFTGNAGVGDCVMLTDSRFDIDGNTEPIAGTLEMHNQSEFKVGGYLKMNGVTINGPTGAGEYAIVKCGKVYATWDGALNVNNRVYFDFNPDEIYGMYNNIDNNYRKLTPDDQWQWSAAYGILQKIGYWIDENTVLNEVAIPEGCAGTGYNPEGNDGGEEDEGDPIGFRFCFEDNFPEPGDYDFNDLVVTVVPSLNDKTLNIKVTLDAVGGNEQLAAGLRLVGLTSADVASEPRVVKGFTAVPDNYSANLININTTESVLAPNVEPNKSNNYVFVLFKDAHYAINPVNTYPAPYIFYNTMSDVENPKGARVTKKTAEYEIEFKSAETAQQFLSENVYDLFLVENYNGAYWEVHTKQYKLSQVFHQKPQGYSTNYNDVYVWALKLPQSFKYPVEWQAIGTKSGATTSGAYLSFGNWAQDDSNDTYKDWWKTPSSAAVVYDESQLEGNNIPATYNMR